MCGIRATQEPTVSHVVSSHPNRRQRCLPFVLTRLGGLLGRGNGVPLLLLLTAAVLSGCSALIDVDDVQCNTAKDCVDAQLGTECAQHVCSTAAPVAADGGKLCSVDAQCSDPNAPRCMRSTCVSDEIAERYGCASQLPIPDDSTIRYTLHVIEFMTHVPPINLRVRACRLSDATCDAPVQDLADDGTGLLVLVLPRGFDGYYELEGQDFSVLLYTRRSLLEDTTERDMPLPSKSTVAQLSQLDRTMVDPSKGLALLEQMDCAGTPSEGIAFSESTNTARPFYLVNNLPSNEAQSTMRDPVSNIAVGGFLNVDPGLVTFKSAVGAGGPPVQEFRAYVRSGTTTFIDLYL